MCGNAAIQAAERLRGLLLGAVAAKLGVAAEALAARGRRIGLPDDPDRSVSFAEAVVLAESLHGVLAVPGSYAPPKRAGKYKGGGVGPSPCYSYTACVVEVQVDNETGHVQPTELWLAHDIGRALNQQLLDGQVDGPGYMGHGDGPTEEQR